MTTFLAILAPTSGIIGVILGILLNEVVRRKNRREVYAPAIFEKRLIAYEGLLQHIDEGSDIADQVIKNPDLTAEQRNDLISQPILAIANYVDRHRLYLDEELALHCTAIFMGVEDIQKADGEEREELLKDVYHMRAEAIRMIEEDSGVAELKKLFKSINRPKLDGPMIEYMRKLRQQQKKTG